MQVTELPEAPARDPAIALLHRVVAALNVLAARPGLLCLLALALNALVQPYVGLIHDARLYALQVTNRVQDGAFSHDLFLRYGSQDSYSLFSLLTAPLVAHLGVPCTFFLFYLLARSLFFFALACFVLKLFGHNARAALAVLILAVDPVPFGGFGVFNVNEAFLTPRLPAVALTLLGLTALLQLRWLPAAACFFVGCLLHPLIAIVGFPLLLGWAVLTRWPERGLAALTLLVCAGCLLVLGIPPLAYRIFGFVDATWLEQVRLVTTYNFPLSWREVDHRRLIAVVGIVLTAAFIWRSTVPDRARFLALTILIAVGGLVATTVASEMGYRILFQGQPYRALWVIHLLAVPCLLNLLVLAWSASNETYRLAGVAATAVILMTNGIWQEWVFPLMLIPVCIVWCRGLGRVSRDPEWISSSLAASLVVGMVAWGIYRFCLVISFADLLADRFDTLEFAAILWSCLGLMLFTAIIFLVLVTASGWIREHPAHVGLVALSAFLLLQSVPFGITQTNWYRDHHTAQGANSLFIGDVLADRHADGKVPTVYWLTGRVELTWLRVRACNYFDHVQLAGLLYNRDTSRESYRRAQLVGPFEIARLARVKDTYPDTWRSTLEQLHKVTIDNVRADVEELERLASEPLLDYVVLDRDLGVPHLASNGKVYVYDCRQLRAEARR